MTQDEIIEMAKEAGIDAEADTLCRYEGWVEPLETFAKLVAAKEREKTLQLWMLLDDVDTADDIAKADDTIYRSLCRQAHAKRWNVLNGDEVDAAIHARGQL